MPLNYHLTGTGTPFVLSAGIGNALQTWSAHTENFSRYGATLCWDYPGHGQSDEPEDASAYERDNVVTTLTDMIHKAGGSADNPAVLVGHSLGGYLSLTTAIRYPERVRALVLIATGPGFRNDEARKKWNEFVQTRMKLSDKVSDTARAIGVQPDCMVMDHLQDIRVPTLLIAGNRDDGYLAGMQVLSRKLPDAELVMIEGAGHHVHETHAQVVWPYIQKFLENRLNLYCGSG